MTTLSRERIYFKRAVIWSVTAHVVLFLFILLSPYIPKPSRKGMIHYVNVVSLPGGGGGGGGDAPAVTEVMADTEIPERETTLYAYLNDIPFQSIPCPYAREAMRTDIRVFLNRMEEKRPGTKFITLKTGLKLGENINHNYTINICTRCGETTSRKLCRVCQILDTLDSQ